MPCITQVHDGLQRYLAMNDCFSRLSKRCRFSRPLASLMHGCLGPASHNARPEWIAPQLTRLVNEMKANDAGLEDLAHDLETGAVEPRHPELMPQMTDR